MNDARPEQADSSSDSRPDSLSEIEAKVPATHAEISDLDSLTSATMAEQAERNEQTDAKSGAGKTVALVLGSGGARGYTHIGVIDELLARGYQIKAVSGCSIGAIIGGFYCAGKMQQLRDWATQLSALDVLKLVDFSLLTSGVIRGDRVFNHLASLLDDAQIEQLPLPFTAVATDISNKKEVWFQSGSVAEAIRASAAIPSVLTPVLSGSRLLVDGGLLNPLPIAPCVSAHADFIIAVDLNGNVPMPCGWSADDVCVAGATTPEASADAENLANDEAGDAGTNPDAGDSPSGLAKMRKDWFDPMVSMASQWFDSKRDENGISANQKAINEFGKLEMLNQMFEVMQASLAEFKTAGYPPDLLIKVPSQCCDMYEFQRAAEMIDLGRHLAVQALDAFEQGQSSPYAQGNFYHHRVETL